MLKCATMREVVLAFIDRINAHDVEGLAALMSDDPLKLSP